jgi:iron complex outermembrane receptor protein
VQHRSQNRWIIGLIFVSACGLALAQPGAGDGTDQSLADLLDYEVVSVSKVRQKASGAPAPVTVINADDIRIYGYRSLDEILDSVRGFGFVTDRIYAYAGVRGFAPVGDYNYRLLLMIDGVRVNSNVYDQAMLGSEFSLDVDLIDRVEVVHGPGSSIYGSNALFGVVNVITRKGGQQGNSLRLAADSLRQKSLLASLGGQTANGGDYLLALSGEHAPGESLDFPELAPSPTRIRNGDYLRNQRLFGKFHQGGLDLLVNVSRREKGNPAALSSGVLDPRNQLNDEQAVFNLSYSWRTGATTEAQALLSAGGHNYVARYVSAGDLRAYPDEGEGRWLSGEGRFVSHLAADHRLIYGLEIQNDYRLSLHNESYGMVSSGRGSRTGLYLQDEWQARPSLSLTFGGRLDRLSGIDDQFSPRLALVWQASPHSILKTSYGSAFRAPNLGENSWLEFLGGTRALQPERIDTLDASIEHYPNIDLRLTASLYAYLMRNQIALNPAYFDTVNPDPNYMINLDRIEGQGIEAEVEKLLLDGSHLRASLSLQRVRDQAGNRPQNSPDWLAKLNYDRALFRHWFLGLNVTGMGRMKTNLGQVGASAVTDLTLSHRQRGDGWMYSLSVQDLFDERPAQPILDDGYASLTRETVPAPARSLRLNISKRF